MDLTRVRLWFAFGSKARSELYDILANFVEDGMPVFDAVNEVHKRLEADKNVVSVVTGSVLRAMRGATGHARTIGQAFAPHVDPIEAMSIDAGTEAGRMAEGFRMAKRLCDTSQRVRARIAAEATYPLGLLLLFFAFLVMIGKMVLPILDGVLSRERWPADAKVLGWLGDNAMSIVLIVVVALVGGGIAFLKTKRDWTGPMRDRFDHNVFPWSVSNSVNGALLLSSVAVMLRAGVPFDEILQRLGRSTGEWERYHFARMRAKLRRGLPEGEALASELYAKSIRWQIELYGRVSNFAEGIDKLSHRVVEQILARVGAQFAFFRYVVMFLVAGMVVWTYWTFLSISMAARAATGLH